jgi:hypothetical protein
MNGYRTNPYISATQGFLDAYMKGMQLALQKRQIDIQERRAAIYDRYITDQMNLRYRKTEEYPWKRFSADIPGGKKRLFEQHNITGETRPLEGFEPTERYRQYSPEERVRNARMIMENALSDQEYEIGEQILRDAIAELATQKTTLFKETPSTEAMPKEFEPTEQDLQGMLTPEMRKSKILFAKGDGKRVKVVNPNGEVGTIPESQLEEAIRQGFKIWKK